MGRLAKRRLLRAIVLAMALWPALHIGLVLRYDLNPWRGLGWGMYAAPTRTIQVRIDPILSGEAVRFVHAPPIREKVRAFVQQRLAFGRLASAEALAKAALESASRSLPPKGGEPPWEGVEVVIRTHRIDAQTARWKMDEERLHFSR